MIFLPGEESVEEVLEIRAKAKQALRDGGTVISWNIEGSSATLLAGMTPAQIFKECNDFLRLVCPERYGAPVKQAIPFFM
jgi:hypothetical protein